MHHPMPRALAVPAPKVWVAVAGITLVGSSLPGSVALGAQAGFGVNSKGSASEVIRLDSSQATELIVRFKNATITAKSSRVASIVQRHRLGKCRSGYGNAFCVLSIPPGADVAALCRNLRRDTLIAYAEPNRVLRAAQAPPLESSPVTDPLFSYQWNLRDDPGGIHVADAWTKATGEGVVVAVLDTGIAYEDRGPYRRLPDFSGTRFVPGYDFVNDDPYANDDRGHGTHVAGVIAQATNNGVGTAGVAPGATLMPVKVLNAQGIGTDDWIASGIRFAADRGARVINMSLGGPGYSQTIQEAIEYAASRGALILAAAGNMGGSGIDYPASAPQCLAVGATRIDSTRCYYSNTGPELDLVAPGGDLTVDQNRDGYPDGILQQTIVEGNPGAFRYRWEMGTSFSVAHVSGIAALVWSLHPDWSALRVRQALIATARDLGPSGPDEVYGYGLVDAAKAVASEEDLLPSQLTTDYRPLTTVRMHDVRIDAVQSPETLPFASAGTIAVVAANAGALSETVAVTLTDAATQVVLGPRKIALAPGATARVTFDVRGTGPLGRHRWTLKTLLSPGADEYPQDNERTVEVTVVKGSMALSLQPGKPSYRRGERVVLSLSAFSLPDGGAIQPLGNVSVRVVIFGTMGSPLLTGTATTDARGRASLSLPFFLGGTGVGTFRAQATAAPSFYEAATASTTFVVNR